MCGSSCSPGTSYARLADESAGAEAAHSPSPSALDRLGAKVRGVHGQGPSDGYGNLKSENQLQTAAQGTMFNPPWLRL